MLEGKLEDCARGATLKLCHIPPVSFGKGEGLSQEGQRKLEQEGRAAERLEFKDKCSGGEGKVRIKDW